MSKKKVARIVVEALEKYGVKRCYGIVGDTLNGSICVMRKQGALLPALNPL